MINCKRLRSCLCFCTFQICGIDDDGDDGDDDDDGDDGDDDDDDIYYDEVSVCLFVTKKEHFLLGVSCNHL